MFEWGICGERTGVGDMDWCHAPLDQFGDCPHLEEHWDPACKCGQSLRGRYYKPCPECGMFSPI